MIIKQQKDIATTSTKYFFKDIPDNVIVKQDIPNKFVNLFNFPLSNDDFVFLKLTNYLNHENVIKFKDNQMINLICKLTNAIMSKKKYNTIIQNINEDNSLEADVKFIVFNRFSAENISIIYSYAINSDIEIIFDPISCLFILIAEKSSYNNKLYDYEKMSKKNFLSKLIKVYNDSLEESLLPFEDKLN